MAIDECAVLRAERFDVRKLTDGDCVVLASTTERPTSSKLSNFASATATISEVVIASSPVNSKTIGVVEIGA